MVSFLSIFCSYCFGGQDDIGGIKVFENNCHDNTTQLIRYARKFNGTFVQVAAGAKLDNRRTLFAILAKKPYRLTNYYQWIMVDEGRKEAVESLFDDVGTHGIMMESDSTGSVYACYDRFCGDYRLPSDITRDGFKMPRLSRDVDYILIDSFYGCPTHPCFDSNFDAAYSFNNQVVLIRGPYFWTLDTLDGRSSPQSPRSLTDLGFPVRNYDAAFTTKTNLYLMSDDHIWNHHFESRKVTDVPLEQFFKSRDNTKQKLPVLFAFHDGVNLALASENEQLTIYRETNSTSYFRVTGPNRHTNPYGATAAFTLSNRTYLLQHHFFIEVKFVSPFYTIISEPAFIPQQWLLCHDS